VAGYFRTATCETNNVCRNDAENVVGQMLIYRVGRFLHTGFIGVLAGGNRVRDASSCRKWVEPIINRKSQITTFSLSLIFFDTIMGVVDHYFISIIRFDST
jgi:hypothetical protein